MNKGFMRTLIAALLLVSATCGEVAAMPFIAFSMQEASRHLKEATSEAMLAKELGGMTRLAGMVFDERTGDIIIVGEVVSGERSVSIDDLVVAMRTRLKWNIWPKVSIDKTEETQVTGKQTVRFEGLLENTGFGRDLLIADVALKKLALGHLPTQVWGFQSYFGRAEQFVQTNRDDESISSRFWFEPRNIHLSRRQDVFAISDLQIGVSVQVLGATAQGKPVEDLSSVRDVPADGFVADLTKHYYDLRTVYPELARLKVLFDLVGLAEGMRMLNRKLDLTYWLDEYKVAQIETESKFPLLRQKGNVLLAGVQRTLEINGGIEVKALVSSLRDGDVTALKDAVLKSKPSDGILVWEVPLEGWQLQGYPENIVQEVDSSTRATRRYAKAAIGCTMNRHIMDIREGRLTEKVKAWSQGPFPFPVAAVPRIETFDRLPRQSTSRQVGGVMLSGSAIIAGDRGISPTVSGNFSLLCSGANSSMDPIVFKKFVTALWAVYYSKEDPGISIDPIAWGVDKQLVRYIGRVINTDLGRVMREADYTMKKWAVGTEKPDISGFRDVDEISGMKGMSYADAFRRFWFVPENLTFKGSDKALLFESGKMTLKTELMLGGRSTGVVASDQEFANFFTTHYDEIKNKYPIYEELFEYAKLVSLVKYLKEKGIPLQWFLLAYLDQVLTEDSKGAVETLSKGSQFLKDVRIEGGVDMPGRYVLDQSVSSAIEHAMARIASQPASLTARGETARRPIITSNRSFEFGKQSYSVVPQHSLWSGKDMRGVHYQTDIAIRNGNQPGLELVRYFRPVTQEGQDEGEFGKGWRLLIPYRVVPVGRPKVPFLNILVPEKMAVRNLLTGTDEILTWDDKTYELAGYRPSDLGKSRLIGLFWTVAGGLRLVDKIGNEFWFNEGLMLSEMHLAQDYVVRFEYDFEEAGRDAYDEAPYRLKAQGTDIVKEYVSIDEKGQEKPLPRILFLTDSQGKKGKVFTFGENDAGLVGYAHEAESPLDRQFIAIRGDARHILVDVNGNETWFDRKLRFEKRKSLLVKAVSQGTYNWNEDEEKLEFSSNHTVKFDYFFNDGVFHIAMGRLYKRGLSTPVHEVAYHYTEDSMLADVTLVIHRQASLKMRK